MVTVSEYLRAAVKGKPLDASDVATLAEAKEELVRLRKVTSRVCDILSKSSPSQGGSSSQPPTDVSQHKKKFARKALAEVSSGQSRRSTWLQTRFLKSATNLPPPCTGQ